MSADERELTVRDIQDEETYFQYQRQEQAKLLDADSAAYEELKPLLAEWNADKGKNEEDEEEAENKIREYLKKHNEGKENNEYLVRGAELQCSCGSHTRKLHLGTCHGVYIKNHPVVHELDCLTGDWDNITWYGACCKENPDAERIIVTGQNGEEIRGSKCYPEIVGIWMDSYEGTKIVDNGNKMKDDPENPVGCNALTVGSFLVCRRGGIISPVNSGQDRTVKVEEFKEGQEAYDRVLNFENLNNVDNLVDEQLLYENNETPQREPDESELKKWAKAFIPHYATNYQVLQFLFVNSLIKVSDELVEEHYQTNLKKLTEASGVKGAFYQANSYIENQNDVNWSEIKFGAVDMKYAGCEIMATYNARVSLGEDMTAIELAELIQTYERGGAVFNGRFGTAPTAILQYFNGAGYHADMTISTDMDEINAFGEEYDTIILNFFNDKDDIMAMVHTINVSKEDGRFVCHNGKLDDKVDSTCGSLGEVASRICNGNARLISIIGIDKKEQKNQINKRERIGHKYQRNQKEQD